MPEPKVKKLHVVGSLIAKESYTGENEITPTDEVQTLETAGKLLKEDVTVKPIPYAEVSNDFGGKTVIIGG